MGELLARGHVRGHARNDMTVARLPYSKKPRSLTLLLDSFVPSALRVMDREKIFYFCPEFCLLRTKTEHNKNIIFQHSANSSITDLPKIVFSH